LSGLSERAQNQKRKDAHIRRHSFPLNSQGCRCG
jgi:hypothetical protein